MSLICFLIVYCAFPTIAQDDFDDEEEPDGARAAASYALYKDKHGRFMVNTVVDNNGPFPFLIDTAASRTVMYRSLATLLNLKSFPRRSRRVQTATGPREMLLYPLERIETMGQVLNLGETVALPNQDRDGAAGIIGTDLLRGHVLTILNGGTIANLLDDARELPDANNWLQVRGRPVGYGSLALEVRVNGAKFPAVVDTGASYSIINSAAARELLGSAEKFRGLKPRRITAGAGRVFGYGLDVEDIVIGDRQYDNSTVTIADLSVFRTWGAYNVPAMILGTDILAQGDFAVDLKRWRLYLRSSQDGSFGEEEVKLP